jgi:hypothetical protein
MEANMKICKVLLPVTLALSLMGCGGVDNPLVLSLQPLFTDQDVNFDPGLVGAFGDRENDLTFTFKKSGDTAYTLIVADKEGEKETSGAFDAHLVRLGGFWFLDFYPADPDLPAADAFYRLHLMKAHSIARIWIEGDVVRIALLDSDWVKKGIDEKRLDIKHEIVEDGILLTDTTLAFQDLASRHGNDQEAFPDTLELRRLPDSPEQPKATPEERN